MLADRNGRIACRAELFEILDKAFAQFPWSHWQQRMRAASIPCGEVRSVGEAIRSMEARERKLVTRLEHPELGWLPNVSLPFRFSETPVEDPRPAPGIGEHSYAVLTEVLGYDAERAAALLASGSVYCCSSAEQKTTTGASGAEATT